MNNHKTRDFLTSLPAAETWITPGWCSRKPDFRMPDGCGTRANCDIVEIDMSIYEDMSEYVESIKRQYAELGRATNNLIRPDPCQKPPPGYHFDRYGPATSGLVQDSIERSCECGHMKRTDKALVCPICSTWIE